MERSEFGDLSEMFSFDDESMDYLDGPISGWMRSKATGDWLAFDCQPVVANMLWHWTLIPAKQRGELKAAFEEAIARTDGFWWSVVEDRRTGGRSKCSLVKITYKEAKPVILSLKLGLH